MSNQTAQVQDVILPAGTILRMTKNADGGRATLSLIADGHEIRVHRSRTGLELHGFPEAFEFFFGVKKVDPGDAEAARELAKRERPPVKPFGVVQGGGR